jgi:hypothetical protein
MRAPTLIRLAAAAFGLPLLTTGAHAGRLEPVFDHLKCFEITDRLSRTALTADLTPEQSPPFDDQRCRIELPASHFCTPTAKSDVRTRGGDAYPTLAVAAGETRDFLCYRLRCAKERESVTTTDQFRSREISTRRSDFFCAPAEQTVPSVR